MDARVLWLLTLLAALLCCGCGESEHVLELATWTVVTPAGVRRTVTLPARFSSDEMDADSRVVLESAAQIPPEWRGHPLTLALTLFDGPAALDASGSRMTSLDHGLAHSWRVDPHETASDQVSLRLVLDCRGTPWLTVVPRLSSSDAGGDATYASVSALNFDCAVAGTALAAAIALLYVVLFLFDRRRTENGWVALQGALGAPTVLATSLEAPDFLLRWVAILLMVLVFALMLSAIGAILSYFRRAAPSRGWFIATFCAVILGCAVVSWDKRAGVLLQLVMVAPMEALALGVLVEEYRSGRDRLAAMALLIGWSALMVTQLPNFALFMGYPAPAHGLLGAGLGFSFYYVLQVVVLGRDHTRSLRETEARARELEERSREVGQLNEELRHQIAERSRELTEALARSETSIVPAALETGDVFERRYRVTRLLGRGGMGAVYEVERTSDGRLLALKVVTVPLSGRSAARFAQEAEIGARLQHPNLVSIVDVGVAEGGTPFLVMELVRGTSMEEKRRNFGDERWATPILHQIASGLAELHANRIVHRDLKPANVLLVDGTGACGVVAKISDFGISRFGALDEGGYIDTGALTFTAPAQGASTRDLTQTGALMGTPPYMPPEAWFGPARHPSADVFSFGIVAYEALTGHAPFTVPPVLLMRAGQPLPDPASLDGVTSHLAALVLACLQADPAKRPRARDVAARIAGE